MTLAGHDPVVLLAELWGHFNTAPLEEVLFFVPAGVPVSAGASLTCLYKMAPLKGETNKWYHLMASVPSAYS